MLTEFQSKLTIHHWCGL